MLGSFFAAFGKKENEIREIPQDVIDILNKSIPSNFVYEQDDSGALHAVPRPEKLLDGYRGSFLFDEEKAPELMARLKTIPKEKWPEYLYRTQKTVPTKEVKIGNAEQVVEIGELLSDPLRDEKVKIKDGQMFVSSFMAPVKYQFETPEGDSAEIFIQQVAYDSVVECKFVNVDYPALQMEIYIYSPLVDDCLEESKTNPDKQVVISYSITPSRANSVKEAVTALHIFKALMDGRATINGQTVSQNNVVPDNKKQQIDDVLDLWESVLNLEEKLEVHFRPDAEFPPDEIQLFSELLTCLIEKRAIMWKHPFDHFHVTGIHPVDKGKTVEDLDLIGRESIRYEFLEGPFPCSLLGAEFILYSHTEMNDFVVTNIEYDNEKKDSGEMYIDDAPGKVWVLSRRYITKKDRDNYINRDKE